MKIHNYFKSFINASFVVLLMTSLSANADIIEIGSTAKASLKVNKCGRDSFKAYDALSLYPDKTFEDSFSGVEFPGTYTAQGNRKYTLRYNRDGLAWLADWAGDLCNSWIEMTGHGSPQVKIKLNKNRNAATLEGKFSVKGYDMYRRMKGTGEFTYKGKGPVNVIAQ